MIENIVEVVICPKCGEAHNIWNFDEPGSWPCPCGQTLYWAPKEPDYDAMIKDKEFDP